MSLMYHMKTYEHNWAAKRFYIKRNRPPHLVARQTICYRVAMAIVWCGLAITRTPPRNRRLHETLLRNLGTVPANIPNCSHVTWNLRRKQLRIGDFAQFQVSSLKSQFRPKRFSLLICFRFLLLCCSIMRWRHLQVSWWNKIYCFCKGWIK